MSQRDAKRNQQTHLIRNKQHGCCCGDQCGDRPSGVRRRDFLKVAGLGVVATSLGFPGMVMAGPFEKGSPDHFIPVDKKLARGWVKGLFERGVPEIWRGKALESIGMPVGGIGCGQLYLCGDGTLANWEIFNRYVFSGTGDRSYALRIPKKPVAQGFALHIGGAQTATWSLDQLGFSEVAFRGEYPIGRVTYLDEACPAKVDLDAFSPFIPLNAKDSALPATIMRFTVENMGSQTISISIAGWLENAVCIHNESLIKGLRTSRIVQEKGRTLALHTVKEAPPEAAASAPRSVIVVADFEGEDYGNWKMEGEAFGRRPALGALLGQQPVGGFQGKGLVNSFFGGDKTKGKLISAPFTIERRFINLMVGGGNQAKRTCVNLIVGEEVVHSAAGTNNETLAWHTWDVRAFEGQQARIEIVDEATDGWGHINVDQIEMADEPKEGPTGPLNELDDWGTMVLAYAGENGQGAVTPSAAGIAKEMTGPAEGECLLPGRMLGTVASPFFEILPGQTHIFTFVVAWHMPNFINSGKVVGHEYVNRFSDAAAVAHYVLDDEARLTRDTQLWRDTLYAGTLPYWLLDRLHSTASYLATGTCQWWKSGRFWAWEGVVCCEGTCTHVWNYAHAHARLFPELARSAREMQDFNPDGGGYHPDTGLVGFRSNDVYAADGQCGTILKAYREYQMSGDRAFLDRNWSKIRKTLEFSMQQDADDNGLIENSQHNTYDINFEGPNTFVGSLYLAALRAAEEMAKDVGDADFAARCKRVFESGQRLTMERLWNGEYFIQEVDLEKFPKHQYADGCLADHLFGQGWSRQLHLGAIYPDDAVKKAYESIWKYCWTPDITAQNDAHKPLRWFVSPGEAGLLICTWPQSKHLDHGVIYMDEVWTGIEYQVAGGMIWEGMVEEGLAICRAAHDRYHPLKHNPYNEVECGDHYARAMASWGVLIALEGYAYHGPKGYLAFAPRITPEKFQAPFTAAEGWGSFAQARTNGKQTEKVEVAWGKLSVKELAFDVAANQTEASVTVRLGGQDIQAAFTQTGARIAITLGEAVIVEPGKPLEVVIA